MSESGSESCLSYLEELLRYELKQDIPRVERLSIALGTVELALTPRDAAKRAWPSDLPATVDRLAAAFDGFVGELACSAALSEAAAAGNAGAAKVKAVADVVWAKLTKGNAKDLQHAQHVYNFAALLAPGGPPAGLKKQLDCAGVVTTTYAVCHALALRYPQHADLAAARMQISEDHCWVQLDPAGSRAGTVEVTTDTAAKRGLPVSPEAWQGWLYTGGHAVLCSPHQALAALITSVNPAVTSGKKGVDSEELQAVQQRLLEVLLAERPDALYPAALCALADLKEVAAQDALDAARDRGDVAEVARLLQHRPGDSRDLFERAMQLACSTSSSCVGGSAGTGGELNGFTSNGLDSAEMTANAAVAGLAAVAAEPAAAEVAAGAENTLATEQQSAQQQAVQLAPTGADAAGTAGPVANGSAQDRGSHPYSNGNSKEEVEEQGWQWYVYSYLAAFLARRAEFLASCADTLPAPSAAADAGGNEAAAELQAKQEAPDGQQQQAGGTADGAACADFWQQAVATYQQALEVAARGSAVLRKYRLAPATDEQLFKDVEGVLEEVVRDGLTDLAKRSPGGQLSNPVLLRPLLLLWDGVCWLFSGKAKPSGWVALLIKVAKLFTPEAREGAAAGVADQVSSGPMQAASHLWRDLKPIPLKPLFESADVATSGAGVGSGQGSSERATKRARR